MTSAPTPQIHRWNVILVGLGTSIAALDTTVNIAFPAITNAFALPVVDIQWVVIAYVLTFASLMLGLGRLSDIVGHRRVFRAGLVWSAGAYVLAAAAPSYGWLLAGRAAQGLGTSFILAAGPALITSIHDEAARPRLLGLYMMMFAAAAAFGPALGGILVSFGGWRAVFGFRAPIALLVALFSYRLPASAACQVSERFDLAGALLFAATVASGLLGLNRLPLLADGNLTALALGVIAVLCFAGFLFQERRTPAPIIRVKFFRDLGFAGLSVASVMVNLAGFAPLLLGPYYLLREAHLSIVVAGTVLAVFPIGTTISSWLCGRLLSRISAASLALAGAGILGFGLALATRWGEHTAVTTVLAILFLQGLGLGFFQVAYLDLAVATLPREQRGVAGSLAMLSRTLGIVAGATFLMLTFHAVEAAARHVGQMEPDAFLTGFHGAFFGAALLPFLVISITGARGLAAHRGQFTGGPRRDR
jgi:MFS family permease